MNFCGSRHPNFTNCRLCSCWVSRTVRRARVVPRQRHQVRNRFRKRQQRRSNAALEIQLAGQTLRRRLVAVSGAGQVPASWSTVVAGLRLRPKRKLKMRCCRRSLQSWSRKRRQDGQKLREQRTPHRQLFQHHRLQRQQHRHRRRCLSVRCQIRSDRRQQPSRQLERPRRPHQPNRPNAVRRGVASVSPIRLPDCRKCSLTGQ